MIVSTMMRSIKTLAVHGLRGCGVFSLTRTLSARMARILMYHNFSGPGSTDPDALNMDGIRRQFGYLQRHFRVVPLLQLVEQLASGRDPESRSVALTVDDGRRNCYEFFFPLLKEFELPATFFVVSSFIRREDWIWTDKVMWLSEQIRCVDELAPNRIRDVFRSLNRMRPEERNARLEAMAERAGITIPQDAPKKYEPCSWSELREIADSGLVEVGSHTVTHPILSSVTDEESWRELTLSRSQIEESIGRKVNSFCVPNGMPGDYRLSQIHQIADAGYACAVVSQFGLVGRGSDPYQLPRMGAARKSTTVEFSKYVDGAMYYKEKFGAWFRPQSV
jgi:peptidoglycan/xylan/chitin deacetylase (PgdA/CDA1 family)